jgi:hypothetical protein
MIGPSPINNGVKKDHSALLMVGLPIQTVSENYNKKDHLAASLIRIRAVVARSRRERESGERESERREKDVC